jgi:outer membrane protein OmpA-like peptidoglycan-associated protein
MRPSDRLRALVGAVAWGLIALSSPRAAQAQDAFALERFHPAPAGDRFLGVPSPYVAGDLDLHAALLADYAYRPLVLQAPPAASESSVSYQAVLHANLSLALNRRVLLNLDVPALSIQAGQTTPALHRVDFGDIRLGGRVRLLGENGAPFQLGAGGYFWLPSATGATSGDGSVRGLPYVAAGGLWGQLLWTSMVGVEFRPSQSYEGVVREGSSLDFGAGLGYLVDERRRFQIALESTLSFVLADPSSRNLNAELLFDARYRFLDRFEVGAGLGPGLTQGVGTPSVRGLLLFALVPVADLARAAKTIVAESPSVSADGLLERSVRIANLQNLPPDPRCCSVEPEATERPVQPPAQSGNAARKPLTPDGRIFFDAGSAEVGPSAERAIHAIADYLILHPELRTVEVCGYADIHGTVASNQQLGARRAEAVKRVLIHHSVAPDRLVVRNFGATAPAASSTTSSGMSQNRRVVVRIVEPAAADAVAAPPP